MPKKRMIRAAGYPRVSDPNKKDSTTLESQAKALREYCQEKGYILEEQHLYPEAHTAYMLPYRERPRLRKLLEAARRHEFDVVIVTEFNRLSRRQIEQAVIIDLLDHAGVKVESVTEDFDDSAIGNFMKSVYAFLAEVEREKIVERTTRGRIDRMENGNLPGSGLRRYGYTYVDTQDEQRARYVRNFAVVKVTEEGTCWTEVMVVEFITQCILKGMSLRSITMTLTRMGIPTYHGKGAWHPSTVQEIATDPIYTGKAWAVRHSKQENNKYSRRHREGRYQLPDGVVERIIDPDVFERVQEQLKDNKSFAFRNNQYAKLSLMRGLCRCGICGRSMHVINHIDRRTKGTEIIRPAYSCQKNNGLDGIHNHHTVAMLASVLDEKGWEFAECYMKHPELVRQRVAQIRQLQQENAFDDSDHIQNQLEEIRRKMANLSKFAEVAEDNDTIGMLQGRLKRLEKEKRELEALHQEAVDEEEKQAAVEEELTKFETWAETVRPLLNDSSYTPSYEDKRTALLILGVTATIWPANHEKRYQLELAPPHIVSAIVDNR